jgi:hypothetical protein
MKKIPFINDKNRLNPSFAHITQRCVKATLYHLDGSESEVKLTWPKVSDWAEDQEIASGHLSTMIEHWTKHWIQIRAYQVHMGSITDKGKEEYSISYPITEIPLDKVYNPLSSKWEDPKDVLKRQQANQINRKEYKYLRLYDYPNEAPSFNFDKVGCLAFDASLCDDEAAEFQDILFKAKEEADKREIKYSSIIFFVRPESGSLSYRFE